MVNSWNFDYAGRTTRQALLVGHGSFIGDEMYEKAASTLDTANELINGARQDTYGDAAETARRIGMAWSSILGLGEPIPPFQVQAMMAALKLVRGCIEPSHEDSWIDAAAYTALANDSVAL